MYSLIDGREVKPMMDWRVLVKVSRGVDIDFNVLLFD